MIHFTNVLMVALLTASATCALPTPVRVEKAIARTPFAVSPENPIRWVYFFICASLLAHMSAGLGANVEYAVPETRFYPGRWTRIP